MKALSIAALLAVTPALQGCDILDILQGQPTKAQRQHEARTTLSLPPDRQPDYGELLGGLQFDPEPEAPVVVAEVQPVDPGPPPFECVTIFRVQTCDGGVLYMLDSSGNWILPGRTE